MKPAAETHASPAGRQSRHAILAALRRDIVEGRFAPSEQIPTRTQIEIRFGASSVTVQRAIDQLRREGFVHADGRLATYVSPHPPHLYHYAMVFNSAPHADLWNRLFVVLTREAARFDGSTEEPRRISVHYGVEDHTDNREMIALRACVRTRAVAGLIFPEHPQGSGLAPSALFAEPGIPRVAIMEAPPTHNLGAIRFGAFIPKALDYLASQACRRLAVLCNGYQNDQIAALFAAASKRNLTLKPHWLQMVHLEAPEFARNLTRLLCANPAERPDCLLVANDNLVEHAVAGVLDAGLRIPDDLRIVAHCNFPWPVASVVPLKRVGYDARALLATCLTELESQRGGAAPGTRTIKAVFEDDVA